MLTRRDKMFIGLIAVAVLFCVSISFGKAEKGGRGQNRGRDNSVRQAEGSRDFRNQNQSAEQQAMPNQTRSAMRRNDSSGTVKREVIAARTNATAPAPKRVKRAQTPTTKTAQPVTVNRTVKKVDAPQVSRQNKIAESPRQVDNKVVVPKRAEAPRKVEIAKPQPEIRQPEPIVEKKITPSVPENRIKAEPRKEIRESRPERTVPQTPKKETISEPTTKTDIAVSPDRPNRETGRTERNFGRRDGNRDRKAAEPAPIAEPTKVEPALTEKSDAGRTARSDRGEFGRNRDFSRRDGNRDRKVSEPRRGTDPAKIEPARIEKSDAGRAVRSERRDFDRNRDFGGRKEASGGRGFSRPKIVKNNNIVVNNTIVKGGHSRGHYNVHHRGRMWGHYPRRVFNLVVWPSYYYPVYYGYGPRVVYNYVRPYYHRKYVFVSIGGWWPTYYSYSRYYWYGWHPYNWYGSYPEAYEVTSNTYNYYYYNTTGQTSTVETVPPLAGVDETTFADVRERLAQQARQEPQPQTDVDQLFGDAVKAFEQSNYRTAADALANAIAIEKDDLILPFAYAQALFADDQYNEAANVLRAALENLPPDKEGIFFPRGLYPEDEILFQQIERLENRIRIYPGDADLTLLLGYQYLGIEKYEQAEAALKDAAVYDGNAKAAEILLRLIEKVKETNKIDV